MKKIAILALCLAASSGVAAQTTLPADVNGDGKLSAADAELIYSYILGTADEGVTLTQVDVNGDGTVNTLDVVEVYVAIKEFVDVASVELNHSEVIMMEGQSLQLTATINPSNATQQTLTWESSNTSVATVDANGKVAAIGLGTAAITVTAANGQSATCVVKVEEDGLIGSFPDSDDSEFGSYN